MSTTITIELGGVDLSAYQDFKALNCRDVLVSHLDDKSYSGDLSDYSNEQTVDSGLQQAYIKILRLLDHVSALKAIRNSFSPVCLLPPEILLQIFALCTYRHDTPKDDHWLAFSQVCTGWRELALADPSLWLHPDLETPEIARLMADRAQAMPVFIFTRSVPTPESNFFPCRSKIRSFILSFPRNPDDACMTDVANYFTGYFPALETLVMRHESGGSPEWNAHNFEAPHLQSLILHGWALRNWEASSLGNLTSLDMTSNISFPRLDFTSSSLLDLLRSSPNLVSLALRQVMVRNGSLDLESQEDVQLLCLRRLELWDDVPNINRLLPSLYFPAVDDVTIRAINTQDCRQEDLDILSNAVSSAICTAHQTAVKSATVKFFSDIHSELCIYTDVPSGTRPTTSFTIHLFSEPVENRDFFSPCILTPAFSSLSTLAVTVADHVGGAHARFWESASKLEALRDLQLSGSGRDPCNAPADLLHILCRSVSRGSFSSAECYPALETLTLRGVQKFENWPALSSLIDTLNERERGCKPISIALIECDMHDIHLKKLLQHSRHVRVVMADAGVVSGA